ncbi:hypothetical protein Pmani_006557 [Petrolisthes manimaculis]|uniref:Uncharacterized protein n=1 Tax=Petrolisthes manimaculis TaxID=1843537 RepID=A0AAE1QA78_9EUCA|nr:hypothetical protein Pmani_006557 [Petrolisthes manimaculis]
MKPRFYVACDSCEALRLLGVTPDETVELRGDVGTIASLLSHYYMFQRRTDAVFRKYLLNEFLYKYNISAHYL